MGMKIKLSAHGAYHHQYHVVWIPKYRKKVLKGELKQYLEKGLFDIETFHPDIEIETLSIQVDHIHLVIVIPPKYAVSDIVGTIKANTSREIRKRFPWVKKIYWQNEFAQFIAICRSAKTCEIGENLLSVADPISRLQERLSHVDALIRPPTLQRRPVSGLHPYAAVERSSPPMSPVPEPGCGSVGDVPLSPRV